MAKNTTFGPWLERQIRRREISQAEFSRRMKVSTGTVSNWITGQRVPNPEYCDRIADILAVDLYIATGATNWDEEKLRKLAGPSPDPADQFKPVEYIPYVFKYRFRCDDPNCNGHTMQVLDWEVAQSYRQWRKDYGEDGWREAMVKKYDLWMRTRDLQFYVGTMRSRMHIWTIIGLYYPPLPA